MPVCEGRALPTARMDPSQLFSNRNGYTYNDYIILPGHITFDAHDVGLRTSATRNITLNVPFAVAMKSNAHRLCSARLDSSPISSSSSDD